MQQLQPAPFDEYAQAFLERLRSDMRKGVPWQVLSIAVQAETFGARDASPAGARIYVLAVQEVMKYLMQHPDERERRYLHASVRHDLDVMRSFYHKIRNGAPGAYSQPERVALITACLELEKIVVRLGHGITGTP